ncbi:hypothetical protein [Pseudomonas proteolytica]|uniref:hypothetical protein n=1 Tax=Pseudomonas proteolytica TaxID=219574 RepID=UPI00320B914E
MYEISYFIANFKRRALAVFFCKKLKRKVTRKIELFGEEGRDTEAAGECGVLMLKGYGANGGRFSRYSA